MTSYPISATSPYIKSEGITTVKVTGTGPNQGRQASSHPHQVIFHPDRLNELLVPDLGADKTWRFTKSPAGKWEVHGSLSYAPGSGPRHIAFYGTQYCPFVVKLA